MNIPLQITFRGMEPSAAVETRILERAEKLERFHDRITRCHVIVETHRRKRQGNLFDVRVDLTVPGGEIVASRAPSQDHAHEDVLVAVRDAFDAATRRLEDFARERRGDVKTHEAPSIGRVVRLFDRDGYGFLETPDGLEVYFHENAVLRHEWPEITLGSEVRFVLAEGEGDHGPQASTVRLLGKHHVTP